jgi:transcriptional regulator GlxA family with amidase domain
MASTVKSVVERAHAAAIERVATYITDHPEAPHAHQDLADLAAMNKRTFSHVFLSVMGLGVKAFVRSVRVARAKYLLEETDLSVAQVMRSSGFASADSGRRAFLLTEQVAPLHYRSRLRDPGEG